MQAEHLLATEILVDPEASDSRVRTSPTITIEGDGSIFALARSGLIDMGSTAAIVAIIAEELRMSIDRISIESSEAAAITADDVPAAVALRSTAIAVRSYLLERASTYFHMDASELMLNDGRVITLDGRAISYQDLIHAEAARSFSRTH